MVRSIALICLFLSLIACKNKKAEPPMDLDKKIKICDAKFNFDSLAASGMLTKDDYLDYNDCLCNTIPPNAMIQDEMQKMYYLHNLKGKPVVMYTWSPETVHYENMKLIQDESDLHKSDSLIIFGLSMADPYGMPPGIPEDFKTFRNVIGGTYVLGNFGLPPSFPMAFFINKKGILVKLLDGNTFPFTMDLESRKKKIHEAFEKLLE